MKVIAYPIVPTKYKKPRISENIGACIYTGFFKRAKL